MRLKLSFGLFFSACWSLLLGWGPAARAQSVPVPVWQPPHATGLTITALAPLDDEYIIVAGLIAGTDVNFEGIPKKHCLVGKWSLSQRRFLWTQPMDYATALAVHGSSVYVACRRGWGMNEPSHHTKMQVGDTTITSQVRGEGAEAFLVKLADQGTASTVVWVKQLGQNGYLSTGISALAVQGSVVYLGGGFRGKALRFDNFELLDTTGTEVAHDHGLNCSDGFVAKLQDEGKKARFRWVQKIDGQGSNSWSGSADWVAALAVQDSVVYVAGHYQGAALALGPLTVPKTARAERWRGYPDENLQHSFVARLIDQGPSSRFEWAELVNGPNAANGLAVSGPNVYLTGWLQGLADFGTIRVDTNSRRDSAGLYVAKLADNGPAHRFAWVRQAGTGARQYSINSLVVQKSALYVGGYFVPAGWLPTDTATAGPPACVVRLTDEGGSATGSWAQPADSTHGFRAAQVLAGWGARLYVAGEKSFAPLILAAPPKPRNRPKWWRWWRKSRPEKQQETQ